MGSGAFCWEFVSIVFCEGGKELLQDFVTIVQVSSLPPYLASSSYLMN